MHSVSDAIVAVSSPPGRSARGIVRISGDGLRAALGGVVSAAKGGWPEPRVLTAGRLRLPPDGPTGGLPPAGPPPEVVARASCPPPPPEVAPTPAPKLPGVARASCPCGPHPASRFPHPASGGPSSELREVPCLLLFHAAPRSFTGQDVLEVQVPGHPALLERVMEALLGALRRRGDPVAPAGLPPDDLAGARPAEPGEFTQRAFLAGRLDLTRAEGIAATIGAVSDAQLEAARLLRRGRLGGWAQRLVDRLGQLLALVEAGIDFVDQEDVVPIGPAALDKALADLEDELAALLRRSRSWAALEALPWVVLAGPPNAGKSTLFNALLGRQRAVTSEAPGTTRDVLCEPLRVGAAPGSFGRGPAPERRGRGADGPDAPGAAEVMLVDIAGLDRADRALDGAMQAAARQAIDRAELIVRVSDGRAADDPLDVGGVGKADAPMLRVRAKADLGPGAPGWRDDPGSSECDLCVSAVTGQNVAALRERIGRLMGQRAVSLAGQMLALQPRHRQELRAALAALQGARELLPEPAAAGESAALEGAELIAERMREALDRLGAVGGAMTPDDVIGKVFATFCVGK